MSVVYGWITRRPNGTYLLTYEKPVIKPVGSTGALEIWVNPGDPLGITGICPWSVDTLLSIKEHFGGQEPPVFEPIRIKMMGRVVKVRAKKS